MKLAKSAEKEAELTDHLSELRGRLIRSIIYIVIGTTIAWFLYDYLFDILTKPMMGALGSSKFLLTSFPEAFMIRIMSSLIAGIILMSPFVTFEIWGFVSPALTPEEKRPIKWIAPLSVILFLGGVFLCYLILPAAFRWFASYIPENAELRPSIQASVLFTVKMMLAFGLVFELPVVLMLLSKVGIVNSKMLWSNWRIAMVCIAIIAAVATPSNDAFSMLMMAMPVALLYFISILLVKAVQKR